MIRLLKIIFCIEVLLAVILLSIGLSTSDAQADCVLNCLFQAGTVCVDGNCVLKTPILPVTTPSDIRLDMVPVKSIAVKEVDCSGMDMKNIKVYLQRKSPPPPASFYSAIYSGSDELLRKLLTGAYEAQKDILNRYVFILIGNMEELKPQFHGQDFVFTQWENLAFKEVLASMTCVEAKKSGWFFTSGISVKGDRSDFEGATFTFK
jgi:hypothetical protein